MGDLRKELFLNLLSKNISYILVNMIKIIERNVIKSFYLVSSNEAKDKEILMIRELFEDIYQIEVELPDNPLRALNAYLIKGNERNLLVDTGFRKVKSLESLRQSLKELNVNMDNTDIFLTHLHDDHTGLVPFLLNSNNKAYIHPRESEEIYNLRKVTYMEEMNIFNEAMGFPKGKAVSALKALRDQEGFEESFTEPTYTDIKDGETLKVGKYEFKCILTPGHTPAHCCLYEENHRILIGGDLILAKITPNIAYNLEQWMENPLQEYFDSLDRVASLPIDVTLSSHRAIIRNTKRRIRELKDHYDLRLEEIMDILANGEKLSPYEIAGRMHWSITVKNWEDFPITQRFFALGECMSHLVYLEKLEMINKLYKDGKIYYVISNKGLVWAIVKYIKES